LFVCGSVSRETTSGSIDGAMLGGVVFVGFLGDGYNPEFSAAGAGENYVAILADVDGVGRAKDFTSMVAKVGGGYQGLVDARDDAAICDLIREMWQIKLSGVRGAERGTVCTGDPKRIAIRGDIGGRSVRMEERVCGASVEASVFIGLVGRGTATATVDVVTYKLTVSTWFIYVVGRPEESMLELSHPCLVGVFLAAVHGVVPRGIPLVALALLAAGTAVMVVMHVESMRPTIVLVLVPFSTRGSTWVVAALELLLLWVGWWLLLESRWLLLELRRLKRWRRH
jgi:hypothetical protein